MVIGISSIVIQRLPQPGASLNVERLGSYRFFKYLLVIQGETSSIRLVSGFIHT